MGNRRIRIVGLEKGEGGGSREMGTNERFVWKVKIFQKRSIVLKNSQIFKKKKDVPL